MSPLESVEDIGEAEVLLSLCGLGLTVPQSSLLENGNRKSPPSQDGLR